MPHGQLYYNQIRSGGANIQTGAYILVDGDAWKLVVHNSGSAHTFTLPAVPPSSVWMVEISNIGAGALTVNPNGLNLDGSGASLTLSQNQGIVIYTDGTNYFSARGSGGLTSPLTTKGDVWAWSTTNARVPVGTDGQVLTADSTQTTGLKWAPGGGSGALTQIAQNVLGASAPSVTLSGISGAYTNLVLTMMARSDVATTNVAVYMQFNGDTAAHYDREFISGFGSGVTAGQQTATAQVFIGAISAANNTSGAAGALQLRVFSYAATTFWKQAHAQGGNFGDNTSMALFPIWFNWRSTAAITSILLAPSSGNFITGSTFTLYGET